MLLVKKTVGKFGYDPSKLTKGSNKPCLCSCDYCGDTLEKKYFKWINSRKYIEKDACSKKGCRLKKQEANNFVRRGVKHHSQTKEYKEKFKRTCLERYGVNNPFANNVVKDKVKQTNLERYGVENPQQVKNVRDKTKETNLLKYGVEYPYQNSLLLKKAQDKIEERYGFRYYAQTEKFREKFSGLRKLSKKRLLDICDKKNCKPLFNLDDYDGCREVYDFECLTHNLVFETQIHYLAHPIKNQCPKCKLNGTSLYEQEIFDFIKAHKNDAQRGNRVIIAPKELDVYVLDKNLGVEFNGLYWHSEIYKEKKYHLDKFEQCKQKGVKLIQIYEDEWRDKRDIWESVLKVNLGCIENKIFARKLNVVTEKSNKINSFFKENHLSGNVTHFKSFHLEDENKNIYSALSLRSPFVGKRRNFLEVARFVTLKDHVVVGGFSKLMKRVKEWARAEGYLGILTYSDCRYSWGDTYQKYGFTLKGHTGLSYDYTDFVSRYGRFKFRAQLNKTEQQVAQENNVYRIYGPGNYRWELTL